MILKKLSEELVWKEFLNYKIEKNHLQPYEEKDLKAFIDNKEYLPVVESILAGSFCAIPEKKLINKLHNNKKRTVYIFPREFNYVLKLMTYLLIRKYDYIFSENLYSFRTNFGVCRAVSNILTTKEINKKYSYKVDISNYFNSIPVEPILAQLKEIFCDDNLLYNFFERFLRENRVLDEGKIIEENKGVMAGTPTAVFLANLYLIELDKSFDSQNITYARYSDDIIFFAKDEEELNSQILFIKEFLAKKGLSINPEKEIITRPGEAWSFLGVSYQAGVIDVSPIALQKILDKIRRKAKAIKRWQIKKKATEIQAVRAFIRSMNRKFFDAKSEHDLTWCRWYFPVITTTESLHKIDLYMQQWIRFIATGKHTLKNYNLRYETLKENGYRSLVNEYYK